MKNIQTTSEFNKAAEVGFNLMNKGEGKLTQKEMEKVKLLSNAIHSYEKKYIL